MRDYSWPCVLVMVSQWEEATQFGSGKPYDPTDMVPKTLYLDDGLAVPVCVVAVKEKADDRPAVVPLPPVAPDAIYGGGTDHREQPRGDLHRDRGLPGRRRPLHLCADRRACMR